MKNVKLNKNIKSDLSVLQSDDELETSLSLHCMATLHLRFMVAAGYAKQTNAKPEYVFIKKPNF